MRKLKEPRGQEHYIFVANSVDFEPFTTGDEITRALAARNMWLASRFTPFRQHYMAGDRVLLYVAGRGSRYFVGDGEIDGATTVANEEDLALAATLGLDGFAEKIPLRRVAIWTEPVLIRPLVGELSFIKDKVNYGLNLRQAAARIPAADFALLIGKKT
jgi:hypothetical protein